MNDLPPIDPTGAMSSGEYTVYMIEYNNLAADVVSDNLTEFETTQTMEDWYSLWGLILDDISERVTALESGINTLTQQIRVVENKLRTM